MSKTWVDIDLDVFNKLRDPLASYQQVLDRIPRHVSACLVSQHHQVLPCLREAINYGAIVSPFRIVHIDQHHDFYPEPRKHPDCATYMWHVPSSCYTEFTWLHHKDPEYCNWSDVVEKLRRRGKKVRARKWDSRHYWRMDTVGFVSVALSPDYIVEMDIDLLRDMIDLTVEWFGLGYRLETIYDGDPFMPSGWKLVKV